eukprot:COSAG01_NODE_70680_length_258_cov_0.603774_1_plen_58_part_10
MGGVHHSTSVSIDTWCVHYKCFNCRFNNFWNGPAVSGPEGLHSPLLIRVQKAEVTTAG